VEFDLAVVCHNTRGQRGRHQREALRYATWGLTPRPLCWIRATYRRRLGIEASSRHAHQARMRARSRKPALRLLFLGVALVLRNVWVWVHAEVMAQPRHGARHLRPPALRFARLLLWLLMEMAHHYRLLRNIPVYHDLYERAQAFGIVFQLLSLAEVHESGAMWDDDTTERGKHYSTASYNAEWRPRDSHTQ
jgi:hypothetical protein